MTLTIDVNTLTPDVNDLDDCVDLLTIRRTDSTTTINTNSQIGKCVHDTTGILNLITILYREF